MGAVPGLDFGGTGTQGLQPVGGIPYVLPGGKTLGMASITAGQVLIGGGTGTPTGLDLFGTNHTWTSTQHFTVSSGDPLTWGRGTIRGRLVEVIPGDFQLRTNSAGTVTAVQDDVSKPSWAIRFSSTVDDFAIFRAPPGGSFPAIPAFKINNVGAVGINQNNPLAFLHVLAPDRAGLGLRVDILDAPNANIAEFYEGGNSRIQIRHFINNTPLLELNSWDNSASHGPYILVRNNHNGATPAAGFYGAVTRTGAGVYWWPDAAGILRIGTNRPTFATDTSAGPAVGDQSSTRDVKTDILPMREYALAHQSLLDAADALASFRYKDGRFDNELFPNGLIIDDAPRYGRDRSPEHPDGRALNEIVLFGDLVASTFYVNGWLTGVDTRLAAVEAYENTDRPRVDLLELTVGNNSTHLTSIDETLALHAGRLIQLESGLAGLPLRVADIEALAQTHTGQINGLVSADVTLQSGIDTVTVLVTAQAPQIAALQSTQAAHATTIADLVARVSALEVLP